MALRVVAGSAGGLHLKVPRGVEIRPTQDRIKEVIFSSLGEWIGDAHVLDLYAGTGALGIEALSRGAASSVFVEKQRECARCIEGNLAHCKLSGRVVVQEVKRYLTSHPIPSFDVVLADPPYDKNGGTTDCEAALQAIRPWLRAEARLIWECHRAQTWTTPPWAEEVWVRDYGETRVAHFKLREEADR
jgi:16S rRNA (guanine966-N2)-methyltransferase